ncbi:hypothetical protein MHYP_G00347910 [Metynnis hypsauchen]
MLRLLSRSVSLAEQLCVLCAAGRVSYFGVVCLLLKGADALIGRGEEIISRVFNLWALSGESDTQPDCRSSARPIISRNQLRISAEVVLRCRGAQFVGICNEEYIQDDVLCSVISHRLHIDHVSRLGTT